MPLRTQSFNPSAYARTQWSYKSCVLYSCSNILITVRRKSRILSSCCISRQKSFCVTKQWNRWYILWIWPLINGGNSVTLFLKDGFRVRSYFYAILSTGQLRGTVCGLQSAYLWRPPDVASPPMSRACAAPLMCHVTRVIATHRAGPNDSSSAVDTIRLPEMCGLHTDSLVDSDPLPHPRHRWHIVPEAARWGLKLVGLVGLG